MLLATGRALEAIDAFRKGLAIRAEMAAADNAMSNRHSLVVSHNKLGDAFRFNRKIDEALAAHNRALALIEQLVAADGNNVEWLRGLWFTQMRIGIVAQSIPRLDDALAAYRAGAAAAERGVARQPGNVVRRNDLALSFNSAGYVLNALKRYDEAIASFERALALHAQNGLPAGLDGLTFQFTLGGSHEGIGEARAASGRRAEALASFAEAGRVYDGIVAFAPDILEYRRVLAYYLQRQGQLLQELGRAAELVAPLRRRLALVERLVAAEADNPRWRRELVISLYLLAQGGDAPRANLTRALEVARALAAAGQIGAAEAEWIPTLEKALAALPS